MKLFILKNPCLFLPFLDLCLECWQTKVCWASDGHILRAAWQCLHVAWHVGIELRILTFLQAHSLRCLPRSQVSSENLLPQRKHFLLTLSSLLEKKSNKFKLTKHPVPVNTVNTKIISTFVASVPIFASIQHISPHLGTTLIQIINGHSIYWENVINSPALYHSRWNSAYWCLESIIWVWHCSGST